MEIFVGTVLIDENERIFLIKENDKNKIGLDRWNLPGGSVDGKESLIEAACRETKEETGYETQVTSLLGCYKCAKKDKLWVYIVFGAAPIKKMGRATDLEVKKGKWFTKQEFMHLDVSQLVHPDMQLVYKIAISGRGCPVDSVKSIDYSS
jgi:ADP-ribose pyrophosphatase YjhB (NUDIX family)